MKKRFIAVTLLFTTGLWLWVSNEGTGISFESPISPTDLEEGEWQLPEKQAATPPPPAPTPAAPAPPKTVQAPRPVTVPKKTTAPAPAPPTKPPAKNEAAYLEQVEESWGAVTSHLFNERFGMGQEDYQEYLRLRNAFQTERSLTLEERSAAGLTPEEERQIVDSIKQRHQEDLCRQIGDERCEDYRMTLTRFNQALRLQQRVQGDRKNTPQITVEF